MGLNLQVLGLQAIPRLAEKLGVSVEFPNHAFIESLRGVEHFRRLLEDCGRILASFFEESKASWWDVHCNSDIGLERMAIAEEMRLDKKDTVLDVGCGRGYFSIAAARLAKSVVGLDLMNGLGRHGWWGNYRDSIRDLELGDKVLGVKADARHMPFKQNSFTFTVSVHAIRNFQDYGLIEAAIREMKRVAAKEGSVVVVESLPVARNKSQEAHLEMFRCKVKYTFGELDYLPKEKIVGMFQRVGFNQIEMEESDYNWSAAPPVFCIEPYLPSIPASERENAKSTFEKAATMVKKYGEASPPALLIRGTK